MNTNFLYLHCDEHRTNSSMDVVCDNYLYSGVAGLKALWRAIKRDIEDGVQSIWYSYSKTQTDDFNWKSRRSKRWKKSFEDILDRRIR